MFTQKITSASEDPTSPDYLPRQMRLAIYRDIKDLNTMPDRIELSPMLFNLMKYLCYSGTMKGIFINRELDSLEVRFSESTHLRKEL